jgi:hypothetical protein
MHRRLKTVYTPSIAADVLNRSYGRQCKSKKTAERGATGVIAHRLGFPA